MKNKYAIIDTSLFPSVKVIFTGEGANESNFPKYLDDVKKVYESEEKLGLIFDATKAVVPGFKFQKMQGDWLKENENLMKSYCVGTAYVIPNMLIRNVLKTIFAFQKQPIPYVVSANLKEAEDWIDQRLL